MFDLIRKHQRLALAVLIVLILPSFVFLGVSGYTNLVSGQSDLVKVGQTTITEEEFNQVLRNQFNSMQGNLGEDFDPAMLDLPEVRRSLLDRIVERQVLVELAQSEYFSASDNALRRYIASLPELQEDGNFSPERYKQMLRMIGMDSQSFEQSQRAELALERVTAPIIESSYLPEPVEELLIHALVDGREVQVSFYPLTDDLRDQEVSAEEISQWYETHREELTLPDYVNVEYVMLDEDAARQSVEQPSDEQLRDYYEQNKSRFRAAARAHIAHILIAVPQTADEQARAEAHSQAQEIAALAQAQPDDFAALAKEHSQDSGSASQGGDLGWLNQGTLPAELDEAIFALDRGAVSAVIEGADGYHIFKIIDNKPEQVQDFTEVRAKILDEVVEQLAAEHFADMATQLTELVYEHADSLDAAAQNLQLELKTASGLGREAAISLPIFGADAAFESDDVELLEDPQVRRALFDRQSLQNLENSGVIELAPDLLVAVRATEYVPAHVPALDIIEPLVRQEVQQQKSLRALKTQVSEQLEQLRETGSGEQPFESPVVISRSQPQDLDRSAVERLLAVNVNELPAYVEIERPDGYAIYKINAVKDSELADADRQLLLEQLRALWSSAQERAVMAGLAQQVGVEELPAANEVVFSSETDF